LLGKRREGTPRSNQWRGKRGGGKGGHLAVSVGCWKKRVASLFWRLGMRRRKEKGRLLLELMAEKRDGAHRPLSLRGRALITSRTKGREKSVEFPLHRKKGRRASFLFFFPREKREKGQIPRCSFFSSERDGALYLLNEIVSRRKNERPPLKGGERKIPLRHKDEERRKRGRLSFVFRLTKGEASSSEKEKAGFLFLGRKKEESLSRGGD